MGPVGRLRARAQAFRGPHLALVLVPVVALSGCGGGGASAATIEAKLTRHLVARDLPPKWVRCVPGRGSVFRCNVDFGDLHIQIYCATLVGGRLRAAEWRSPVHGRQDRAAAARECARRLGSS